MSQQIAESIQEKFGDQVYGISEHRDRWRVDVKRDANLDVLRYCYAELGMNYLADVTCIDLLEMPGESRERFEVIYVLRNLDSKEFIVLRAFVPADDAEIESAASIWKAADWLEREVYDMFGIVFRNHPNMIRILTPENFEGNPLLRDFPTEGIGYRDKFPVVDRDSA
jgi:NADH-quinone oxidoreductase subunit C